MVVTQAHSDGLNPSIHHSMTTLNLQHPILGKRSLFHQSPWCFESTEISIPRRFPDGIFHAGSTAIAILSSTGAKVASSLNVVENG